MHIYSYMHVIALTCSHRRNRNFAGDMIRGILARRGQTHFPVFPFFCACKEREREREHTPRTSATVLVLELRMLNSYRWAILLHQFDQCPWFEKCDTPQSHHYIPRIIHLYSREKNQIPTTNNDYVPQMTRWIV